MPVDSQVSVNCVVNAINIRLWNRIAMGNCVEVQDLYPILLTLLG